MHKTIFKIHCKYTALRSGSYTVRHARDVAEEFWVPLAIVIHVIFSFISLGVCISLSGVIGILLVLLCAERIASEVLAEEELQKMPKLWTQSFATVQVRFAVPESFFGE